MGTPENRARMALSQSGGRIANYPCGGDQRTERSVELSGEQAAMILGARNAATRPHSVAERMPAEVGCGGWYRAVTWWR